MCVCVLYCSLHACVLVVISSYCAIYLARMGSQIICAYRGDTYEAKDLKVAGELGQILLLVIYSFKYSCSVSIKCIPGDCFFGYLRNLVRLWNIKKIQILLFIPGKSQRTNPWFQLRLDFD